MKNVKGYLKKIFEYYVYIVVLIASFLCITPPIIYESIKFTLKSLIKLFK